MTRTHFCRHALYDSAGLIALFFAVGCTSHSSQSSTYTDGSAYSGVEYSSNAHADPVNINPYAAYQAH